ncbi:hypothetical protein Salat_1621800 [Sesamum alatum]|uniref:Uncharacterized protein n=1 Tax=Sesamum alatum TaxID=300844 RepID=A0AAE1Y5W9_9LAMI|nr:hypothetical protein Salat_1621800 [Sesamum alatum]
MCLSYLDELADEAELVGKKKYFTLNDKGFKEIECADELEKHNQRTCPLKRASENEQTGAARKLTVNRNKTVGVSSSSNTTCDQEVVAEAQPFTTFESEAQDYVSEVANETEVSTQIEAAKQMTGKAVAPKPPLPGLRAPPGSKPKGKQPLSQESGTTIGPKLLSKGGKQYVTLSNLSGVLQKKKGKSKKGVFIG